MTTQLKQFRELRNEFYFFNDDIKEIIECLRSDESDFEISGYRFISDDDILDVLIEELVSDEYILGCFSASFLAEVIDIDIDVIQTLQKAEAYDGLGKLILSLDKNSNGDLMRDLAETYVQYDGYGNHFNSWDGTDYEIELNGELYHVFRR